MTVSTTNTRAELNGNGSAGPFQCGFRVLANSDLQVYVDGVLKSLTTHYTVANAGTTTNATVTFTSGNFPASGTANVVLVRNVPYTQTSDYQNNTALDAETLETSFDRSTMQIQQNISGTDRAIKFGDTVTGVTASVTDISTGATTRANKILGFDASGNVSATLELGTNRGNWATSTAYVVRDIAKQNNSGQTATYGNIYLCVEAHSSTGSYLTQNDSSKWQLIFDVATTTTNATTATNQATYASRAEDNAEAYAQTAENSQTTIFADVTSSSTSNDGYSALHHREKSKEYAQTVDAQVTNDSGTANQGYSAKEHAVGDLTASGGSAKAWAEDSSSPDGTSSKSAKTWATEASGSASTATTKASEASTSATNASASEVSARNSAAAVASALDSFDDKYLGTMSDSSTQGTNPTPTGTWAKDSSTITVSANTNIKVGQVVTGSGIPAGANVLSIDGTTVVVSASMASAGSSVSLTFTGYGVYGTYNSTKDGPTSDNDNGSLADGMLYFNTTDNQMMVYKTTGAKWIPASSTGSTALVGHKFTASGSETSVSASSFSPTLTYTPANIIVFLNGVRLDATDYTATNGNDITGLSALTASDEVVVYAFKSFEVADAVSASSGGTFSGNVSFGDNNITNVGSIALDSISADATSITISSDMETATNKKIKQKGAFMQSSTHQALVLGL